MGSEAVATLPSIRLHLTGFKKFHNVENNPTEVLMTTIMEFMKDRALPFAASIESCTVLETAGIGSLEFLQDLLGSALSTYCNKISEGEGGKKFEIVPDNSGDAHVVWVHFGVNSGASRFAVEQRAVNEATFRCPDEMGWQPEGVPVVEEDGALSNARETKFPTAKIVAELVKQGFDTVVSYDAGRFVCNYVYYQSLRHAAIHGTRSLFVHVPPFAVIDEHTQLEFIAGLLNVLVSSFQMPTPIDAYFS